MSCDSVIWIAEAKYLSSRSRESHQMERPLLIKVSKSKNKDDTTDLNVNSKLGAVAPTEKYFLSRKLREYEGNEWK